VASTENPVVEMPLTAEASVPAPAVVGVSITKGTDGRVDPNVTVASVPVAAVEPVPQVSDPRTIVDDAFTTGAGGEPPALPPAAAVTVVESQGE
jgi:hypothetical protein